MKALSLRIVPALLFQFLPLATAGNHRLSPDLDGIKGTVSVLVQYRTAPSQTQLDAIANKHKGRVNKVFLNPAALQVDIPADQLEKLADSTDVLYV